MAQPTKLIKLAIEDSGAPGTFLEVENVFAVNFPTGSANVIDSTTLSNATHVSKLVVLADSGQCTFSYNRDETLPNQKKVYDAWTGVLKSNFKVTYPAIAPSTTTYEYTFSGWVLSLPQTAQANNKQETQGTIEIDGALTRTEVVPP